MFMLPHIYLCTFLRCVNSQHCQFVVSAQQSALKLPPLYQIVLDLGVRYLPKIIDMCESLGTVTITLYHVSYEVTEKDDNLFCKLYLQ